MDMTFPIRVKRLFLGTPGWFVVIPTMVWLAPIWIYSLVNNRSDAHWNSGFYWIVLTSASAAAVGLNGLDLAFGLWSRSGICLRVISACGAYTSAALITFILLDRFGRSGSDGPGLVMPFTVLIYWIVAAQAGLVANVVKHVRRRN